jgi:hypothetical protein
MVWKAVARANRPQREREREKHPKCPTTQEETR